MTNYTDYFEGFTIPGFSCRIEKLDKYNQNTDDTMRIVLTFNINRHFKYSTTADFHRYCPDVFVDYMIDDRGEIMESFRFEGSESRFTSPDTLVAAIVGAQGAGYTFPPDKQTTAFMNYWKVAKIEADTYAEQILPILWKLRNSLPKQAEEIRAIRESRWEQ